MARAAGFVGHAEQPALVPGVVRLRCQGPQTSEDLRDDDGTRGWGAWMRLRARPGAGLVHLRRQGRMTTQDIHYDDGRAHGASTMRAEPGVGPMWFTDDTQGTLTTEDRYNDDGTRGWTVDDVNNANEWTDLLYNYDDQGRATSVEVHNDDGTRTWTAIDANRSQPWTQAWWNGCAGPPDQQRRPVRQRNAHLDRLRREQQPALADQVPLRCPATPHRTTRHLGQRDH